MLHQTANNTQYRYVYEWSGKRVLRKASSSVSGFRWYIYDGERVIGEVGTGGAAVAYTWGADGLAATRWITNNASYYYHFGPQGETRQLTDGAGAIQNSYLYNAYGDTLSSTGTAYNRHRYGGKFGYFTDGPMNLLLATHRWYLPKLLRWISRDPIDYKGGDNLYNYVKGRPVVFMDYSGLAPMINFSPRAIPYKPEGGPNAASIQMCGSWYCNVDGVYNLAHPSPVGNHKGPIKIPNNCLSIVDRECRLKIWCIPLPDGLMPYIGRQPGDQRPRRLGPDDIRKTPDWPWPFNSNK